MPERSWFRLDVESAVVAARRWVPTFFTHTYIWVGFILGALFWPIESTLHVVFFAEDTFASQLFVIDPHELWKRLLIFALMSLFGIYAQQGINVRRRSEQALAASEKKHRTLIREALNPIFVFDAYGRFLDFNQSTLDFFELDRDQLLATSYREIASHYPGFSDGV